MSFLIAGRRLPERMVQPISVHALKRVSVRLASSSSSDKGSDEGGNKGEIPDRGAQTKGSMVEYMKKIANKREASSKSLWAKIDRTARAKPSSPQQTATTSRAPEDSRIHNQRTGGGNFRRQGGGGGGTAPGAGSGDYKKFNTAGKKPSGRGGGGRNFRGPAGGGGYGVDDDDSGGRRPRKRRSIRGDYEGRSDRRSSYQGGGGGGGGTEGVPGSIASLLFDTEHFDEIAKKSDAYLASPDMDKIDQLFAETFLDCFKTKDASTVRVIESPALKRTKLPSTRSMAQLVQYMNEPNIRSVTRDTPGYEVAAEAWQVISKNYYFTDHDKYRLVDKIAHLYNALDAQYAAAEEELEQSERSNAATAAAQPLSIDLIHRSDFRPGREYWEEEKRLQRLAGHKPVDDQQYVQEDTDWDVEAVVDEDQL